MRSLSQMSFAKGDMVNRCRFIILGGLWPYATMGHNIVIHHTFFLSYLPLFPLLYICLKFRPSSSQTHSIFNFKVHKPPLINYFFQWNLQVFECSERDYQMAASVFSVRSSSSSKIGSRSLERCSKHIRQQRTRLYIIWRCTVLLLCWQD